MGDALQPQPPAALALPAESSSPSTTTAAAGVEPPAPPALPPPAAPPGVPIVFTGDAREFFRIWVVNTLLTLATLGVYLAWAKVRRKRYFYGHTRVLGHAFDYTARPSGLLVGNIVVLILFLGYAFFGQAYLAVQLATVGVAAIALPWLIVRALAFNARNTVHRGLRFRFRGTYGMAAVAYVLFTLLSVLSLGLMYPYQVYLRKSLFIDYSRYGDSSFHFEGEAKGFYGIYLRAWGLYFAGVFPLMIAIGIFIAWQARDLGAVTAPPEWLNYVVGAAMVLFVTLAKLYIRARLFNYVWNHTLLDQHRFRATVTCRRLVKIQLVNLLAIVGTLGLATPWAMVRKARYLLSCLEFVPAKSLDTVEAFGRSESSAVGEAAADFFGIDIGL